MGSKKAGWVVARVRYTTTVCAGKYAHMFVFKVLLLTSVSQPL